MKKILLLAIITSLLAIFFYLDLNQYLNLAYLKSQQGTLNNYYVSSKALTIAIFFIVYVVTTALSLPGAALMTLLAGAIFGVITGTIIVSFASSIGATLAFLTSRFLLRGWVQNKFSDNLKAINESVKKEGAFYLFTLRLVPTFPFFMINLIMGLTPIKTTTYYLVSQVGMLAGTIVYVNAGTQLVKLDSLSGILSLPVLGSFVLIGLFPLITKKFMEFIKIRNVYKGYKKPKNFETNMIVIGGGAAGLVNAYIASAIKAKVVLIEKHKMGGDCLNYGCVPSKALIRSAKFLEHNRRGKEFGFNCVELDYNFSDVMNRITRVVEAIEPHDSIQRYESLGVECISGDAKIISPWEVEVNGRVITTMNIIIASGATPYVPTIPGLNDVGYYTSDTIWSLQEQPKRMIVLGGGPIGCELAQSFSRLGTKVTQVELLDRIMIREDEEVSTTVKAKFESEGIQVLIKHKAKQFLMQGKQRILICEHENQDIRIEFDAVLIAAGRAARIQDFGLEELGINITPQHTVEVNEYLQTNFPNIYAAGDVAGPYLFTHTASHMAWYTSVNALFGFIKKFKVDYSVIPWATFTDPEVARCGLNELEAKEKGIPYDITRYGIDDLDRAIVDEEAHGSVKILTQPGKDKILGVTIMGEHAGDLIAEYVLAMKHSLGLNKILNTIHIYPTLAEANKYAAGEWKRSMIKPSTLNKLEKLHKWRRN